MRFRDPTVLLLLATCVVWGGCDSESVGPDEPEEQPEPARLEEAAATIRAAEAARRVGVLAHDSLRGRQSIRPEIESAARYLIDELEAAGFEPSGSEGFIHRFELEYIVRDEAASSLEALAADVPLEHGRDYVLIPSLQDDEQDVTGELLWAGPVEAAEPDPEAMNGRIVLYDAPVTDPDVGLIERLQSAWIATQEDAAAVALVLPAAFTEAEINRTVSLTRRVPGVLPTLFVTEAAAAALVTAAGTDLATLRAGGDPRVVELSLRVRGSYRTVAATPPNVAALLRGSDPDLRDEYVALSAHYDHLGTGFPDLEGDSIFNGADDDASGVATVLAIAEALADVNRAPARSVLVLLTSGEEWGKVGSTAFVRNPTVPAEAMVANLAFDMVGRNDPGEIIGSGLAYSTIGDRLSAVAAERSEAGLTVVAEDPDAGLYLSSDNVAFACDGIPALLLTSGIHEDYHRPSDEVDLLNPDKIARVATLGFYLAWDLADSAESPAWTAAGETITAELSCR
ncbi:MAG: M20/M25/M40 family metallo-hydrolase [Gemmatimonadota bacterium]|jgi:hypothetical protein